MLSSAVKQLQSAKQQIASQIKGLEAQASKIDNAIAALTGLSVGGKAPAAGRGQYKRTAAQRKAMAKAQKAHWAKVKAAKAGQATVAKPAKKKRTMSAAAKAKLSAFQKKLWAERKAAKAKAAKK